MYRIEYLLRLLKIMSYLEKLIFALENLESWNILRDPRHQD